MRQMQRRVMYVLAVDARCCECGWMSQPVVLAYSRTDNSDDLWCLSCFQLASETGTFSPGKETKS